MPEERQITIQAETAEEYNARVLHVAATMPFQGEPTLLPVEDPEEPVVEEAPVEEPVVEEATVAEEPEVEPEPVEEPVAEEPVEKPKTTRAKKSA